MKINKDIKLHLSELEKNLHKIITYYFSNINNNMYEQIFNYQKYTEKGKFPKGYALREMLENYRLHLSFLQKYEKFHIFEITWLFNICIQVINELDKYLEIFEYEALSNFLKENNITEYKNLYNVEQKIFDEISRKRKWKRNKKMHLNEYKFYNFLAILRNFLIHPNAARYRYILFEKNFDIQNEITFYNVYSKVKYEEMFEIKINILLPSKYLNNFLEFLINQSETIYKCMKAKIIEYYKIPCNKEIENQIEKYSIHPDKATNFIFKEAIALYDIYYFINAIYADQKYKKIAIKLIRIASYHYIYSHYCYNFKKFLGNFYDDYKSIINISQNDRFSYVFKDLEWSPSTFIENIGSVKYDEIMKRNSNAKLHQNIAAIRLDRWLKEKKIRDITLLEKLLDKYLERCDEGKFNFEESLFL